MTSIREKGRSIRLLRAPSADEPGIFCITSRKKVAHYIFREVPCEIGGRGFAVHRLGLGNLYYVRVGAPEDRSCECMGYLAHGQCKHVLGLTILVEQGLLSPQR